MLREYIQNAVDSIDVASQKNLYEQLTPRIDIRIDKANRSLRITDNGAGITSRSFEKVMLSIGGSTKRGTKHRGFRGIGRFAALSFCKELIFRTKAKSDKKVSEIKWSGIKFKKALSSNEDEFDLFKIVSEICEISTSEAEDERPHFFEVELNGLVRYQNDTLLNEKDLDIYLSQVAPVPFLEDFSYASTINEYLASYEELNKSYKIFISANENEKQVFKPYTDEFKFSDFTTDHFNEVEFKEFDNIDGEIAVVGWVLHSSYLGALPRKLPFKGIRMRDGNIQVGSETLLTQLFKEQRFNSWIVGEFHVLKKSLIPTARRDEFEANNHYSDFQNKFMSYANTLEQKLRNQSSYRANKAKLRGDIERIDSKIEILRQGSVSNSRAQILLAEVAGDLNELNQKIDTQKLIDSDKSELNSRSDEISIEIKHYQENYIY